MSSIRKVFRLAVLVCIMFWAGNGMAAVYKYIDKDGTPCFADNLQSVPEQYRQKAVIVSGELKEAGHESTGIGQQETGSATVSPAVTPARPARSFGSRLFQTIVIVVCAVFLFIILGHIHDLKAHKKILAVSRTVLVWMVSLYLLFAHGMDVLGLFRAVGSEVEHISAESASKGEKFGKTMKKLDEAMGAAQMQSVHQEQSSAGDEKQ